MLLQTRYSRRGWTGSRRLLQHGQRNAFRSACAIAAAATGGGSWVDRQGEEGVGGCGSRVVQFTRVIWRILVYGRIFVFFG